MGSLNHAFAFDQLRQRDEFSFDVDSQVPNQNLIDNCFCVRCCCCRDGDRLKRDIKYV